MKKLLFNILLTTFLFFSIVAEASNLNIFSIGYFDFNKQKNEAVDIRFEKRLDNKLSSIFNKLFFILDHIQSIKYGADLRYKNISDNIITNSGSNHSGIIYIDVKDSNDSLFYPILAIIYKNFVPDKLIRFLKHIIAQAKLQTCIEIITLNTPISFFENLNEYNFLGISTSVPNPVNDYLCFKYGSDWLTPKNKNDWVYYRDDGAITSNIK